MARKEYRDGYMQGRVRAGIAYQLQALRKKFGISQTEMAKRTKKTQSVISRLESEEYGRVSVQTLLDIASGLDVALLVRFVSYPTFLEQAANMSEKALQPETIHESLSKYERHKSPWSNPFETEPAQKIEYFQSSLPLETIPIPVEDRGDYALEQLRAMQ